MAEPPRWIAWQGVAAFVFVTLCLERPWWVRALLLIPGIALVYGIVRSYDLDLSFRGAPPDQSPVIPPTFHSPPILQMSFHSASATGCTDRRDSLTRTMSARRFSALT